MQIANTSDRKQEMKQTCAKILGVTWFTHTFTVPEMLACAMVPLLNHWDIFIYREILCSHDDDD